MTHRHHIVFRSQGGLDYPLNFKYLSQEEHEGKNGPHKNRATDLLYKISLQEQLVQRFEWSTDYTPEEIAKKLGRSTSFWRKHLKHDLVADAIQGEQLIRRLMGGRIY